MNTFSEKSCIYLWMAQERICILIKIFSYLHVNGGIHERIYNFIKIFFHLKM